MNDILSWLQNLLTNKQATQSQQFGQGLGFQQSQLTAQQQEEAARLAAQVAQQQAADKLAQQNQQFQQAQTTKETSLPFLAMMQNFQRQLSPASIAGDTSFLNSFKKRIASDSMGGAPSPYATGSDSPFTFYRAPQGI